MKHTYSDLLRAVDICSDLIESSQIDHTYKQQTQGFLINFIEAVVRLNHWGDDLVRTKEVSNQLVQTITQRIESISGTLPPADFKKLTERWSTLAVLLTDTYAEVLQKLGAS
jgi:DNA phosphorothioation-dependent restriction protein DptG